MDTSEMKAYLTKSRVLENEIYCNQRIINECDKKIKELTKLEEQQKELTETAQGVAEAYRILADKKVFDLGDNAYSSNELQESIPEDVAAILESGPVRGLKAVKKRHYRKLAYLAHCIFVFLAFSALMLLFAGIGAYVISFFYWLFSSAEINDAAYTAYYTRAFSYISIPTIFTGLIYLFIHIVYFYAHEIHKDRDEVNKAAKLSQEKYEELKNLKSAQAKVSYYTDKKSIAEEILKSAKEALAQNYMAEYIHPKYRNIVAVNRLAEYLATGRCIAVEGPDGIYDVFEQELGIGIIDFNFEDIEFDPDEIQTNQYYLYQVIKEVNDRVKNLNKEAEHISED